DAVLHRELRDGGIEPCKRTRVGVAAAVNVTHAITVGDPSERRARLQSDNELVEASPRGSVGDLYHGSVGNGHGRAAAGRVDLEARLRRAGIGQVQLVDGYAAVLGQGSRIGESDSETAGDLDAVVGRCRRQP